MFNFNLLCNLFFFMLIIFSLSFLLFSMKIYFFNKIYFLNWKFMSLMNYEFNFPIYLDFFSSLFLSLVFLISSMIFLYSKIYMKTDKMNIRFIFILLLFVLSMMFFIICPNLISLLLGWDGLGLVSYCLVIFYQNYSSNVAGLLTALSNRIGDSFLIISICIFMSFNTWNFLSISMINNYNTFVVMILLLVSITKSAQIPFSSWLPAAMAAPTPVSSLVHSSTLVTAGVFLMIRFNYFLMKNEFCSNILVLLSLMTLCMAGISANLEMDFKKIIALSTLSQLGMMMSSLSLGLKEMSFFHLVMHAMFKALMFMCSGNFIHLNFSTQDLRFYGKSMFISSFSYTMFCLANLSLCGLPFLCGFYSKDLILELILMKNMNLIIFIMFLVGTSLTIFYSFRVLNFSSMYNFNFSMKMLNSDKNKLINLSMFPLFLLSVFSGTMFSELFLMPMNYIILPIKLKLLILIICIYSVLISILIKEFIISLKNIFKFMNFHEFFNSLMFLVFFSKKMFSKKYLKFAKQSLKSFSDGWIEYFLGLTLIKNLFEETNFFTKNFKNKFLQNLFILILNFSVLWSFLI